MAHQSSGGSISSDLATAQNAVSGFSDGGGGSGVQCTISVSNIGGMITGAAVSNQIVGVLSGLQAGIWAQADKFPTLAAAIEVRDAQDAAEFNQTNWGG
jgi:hypothetical protein